MFSALAISSMVVKPPVSGKARTRPGQGASQPQGVQSECPRAQFCKDVANDHFCHERKSHQLAFL